VASVGDVDQQSGQELRRVGGLGARRRPLGRVRGIAHDRGRPVVSQPLQGDRIPCTVPGERSGKRPVLPRQPDRGVPAKARVRSCEHSAGLGVVKRASRFGVPVTVSLRDGLFQPNVREATA